MATKRTVMDTWVPFWLTVGVFVSGVLLVSAVVLVCAHIAGKLTENEGIPRSVIDAARDRFHAPRRRDSGTQSRVHVSGDGVQDAGR
jgi:hypothetical protein